MPRVARRKDTTTATLSQKSPQSLPIHDDQHEKAARFQSRQALHELHLNQIRAAASPGHRRAQHDQIGGEASADARISTGDGSDHDTSLWSGMSVPGVASTKRVPILANFEEWMKMATDNKINATNSWNFALIDYFHDMSLLKEGDSVNFQKASCTLDGCVKIYTSRVDSVATETGKLLSGLADSDNKGKSSSSEDAEDDEEGENGDGRKGPKKRPDRSSEATLASSFAQIQLKKLELEFSVDPLFKKASADFDEGGAKGLLLNHLCIDSTGRIIFDSSDDTDNITDEATEETNDPSNGTQDIIDISTCVKTSEDLDDDVDIEDLRNVFFPDLSLLGDQDICPSLKAFDLGDTINIAGLSILQNQEPKENSSSINHTDTDDIGLLALGVEGINDGTEPMFGAGGEAWAQEVGLEPMFDMHLDSHARNDDIDHDSDNDDSIKDDGGSFGVKMHFGARDLGPSDILGYFDNNIKSNWAGPEHWRIKKMRKENGMREGSKRKEKEPFELDFQSSMPHKTAEQIYTSVSSNSAISLPRAQWRSRTRHLLPDDKHFNSSHLLRLFLKPKARLGRKGGRGKPNGRTSEYDEPRHIDDAYWADPQHVTDTTIKSDFNADFFREDDTAFPSGIIDEDADEFADAREAFSPAFNQDQTALLSTTGADTNFLSETGYGSSLVTKSRRIRPEYVSYAKVAKKVDVRLLKEKIWKGIGLEDNSAQKYQPEATVVGDSSILKFTSVLNGLQEMYTPEAMADISTSYCFISLLHLANEKGLVLTNDHGLEELNIERDMTADSIPAA